MSAQSLRITIWQVAVWVALGLVPNLVLAGNAQEKKGAGAPGTSSPKAESSSESRGGAPPMPSTPVSNDYVIGPEDLLAVNVWHEPEISRSVPVRPDGKISLPLVGEVEASGLTPLKLQSKITEKLRAFVSNPEVTVIVQEVRSQKVNIVGEVQKPGSYHLIKPMRVIDLIAEAGGFRDFAKVKKIYVLRAAPDGSQQRIPFNYKEVINGRNSQQNIELEPGDTVVVP